GTRRGASALRLDYGGEARHGGRLAPAPVHRVVTQARAAPVRCGACEKPCRAGKDARSLARGSLGRRPAGLSGWRGLWVSRDTSGGSHTAPSSVGSADRDPLLERNVAQFLALCSRLKWSKHFTNSPCLALLAMDGSKAAYKIISACSNAVS